MEIISIREETCLDYQRVNKMVKESFLTATHSDGDEHIYLTRLRKEAFFVPELSFVAEKGGIL